MGSTFGMVSLLAIVAIVVALVAWFWATMLQDVHRNRQLSPVAKHNWFLAFLSMNLFVALAYWLTERRRRH